MNTNQHLIIDVTRQGFVRAMMFREECLHQVFLVALSPTERKSIHPSLTKKYTISQESVPAFLRPMLALAARMLPEPLPKALLAVTYQGCLQRDIVLS